MKTTETKQQKIILKIALAFSLCVFAFVGFVIFSYHPTGIVNDSEGNIVLATALGGGDIIPEDSIHIIDMPDGLMKHLIRTNGAAYGHILYGHFTNTESDTKMFLYLTGEPDTVCFRYRGLLYVTDDWRK